MKEDASLRETWSRFRMLVSDYGALVKMGATQKSRVVRFYLASGGLLLGLNLLSQLPPPMDVPELEIVIMPTNESMMVEESTNAVFVEIKNFDLFTNYVITGLFDMQTNGIVFLDNGRPPDQTQDDGIFTGDVITPELSSPLLIPLEVVVRADVLEMPDPEDPDNPVDPDDPEAGPMVSTNSVIATNLVEYLVVNRPENDNFTNAFKVPGEGIVISPFEPGIVFTNGYASLERGEPVHASLGTSDLSVWWNWSPFEDSRVLIDTSGSTFDAVLAVYRGGPGVTNLFELVHASKDLANDIGANVTFDAQAGITYRIAIVSSHRDEFGSIFLRVLPNGEPDTKGPITSILTPASESLVTSEFVELSGTAKDVQPFGIGIKDVFLQVNNLEPTNALGADFWSGTVQMPPGTNLVRAFAVDYAGNQGPSSAIIVKYLDPVNDQFEDAIELTGVGGVENAVNERATKQPGEPFHAGNEGGRSIWYSWQAPAAGDLTLSTDGSSFDTIMGIYVGHEVGSLVELAKNDDAFSNSGYSIITHPVVAGERYYFAVDGFGSAFGDIVFSYSFATIGSFFGLGIDPPAGGLVSPAGGLFPEGEVVLLTASPERFFEFTGWEDLSSDFVSTENPLPLVMNQNYNLRAKFRVTRFSETFERGDFSSFPWQSFGASPWVVQDETASGGSFAAKSGPIGDGQSSSLTLVMDMFEGTGAFSHRVHSEEGWDWLEFYLNGSQLGRWSGLLDWDTFTFRVQGGVNTLEWRYVKDPNFSHGLDAAFIDDLFLPLEEPESPETAPRLTVRQLPTGVIQVTAIGQPNVTYLLEASDDLKRWTALSTSPADGVSVQFLDFDSVLRPYRFYRVIIP